MAAAEQGCLGPRSWQAPLWELSDGNALADECEEYGDVDFIAFVDADSTG